jgi:hypothetical protein
MHATPGAQKVQLMLPCMGTQVPSVQLSFDWQLWPHAPQ